MADDKNQHDEDFDEETNFDEDIEDEDFDTDLTDEDLSEEEELSNEEITAAGMEHEISDEEEILEEEVSPPVKASLQSKTPAPKAMPQASAPSASPASSAQQAPASVAAPQEQVRILPLKPEEIPLSVVVEVGRFHIPVKKLLELEPGNLLEIDVHPEKGVDLVVNGKIVGRGELIRLGDVLGVRILEMGK